MTSNLTDENCCLVFIYILTSSKVLGSLPALTHLSFPPCITQSSYVFPPHTFRIILNSAIIFSSTGKLNFKNSRRKGKCIFHIFTLLLVLFSFLVLQNSITYHSLFCLENFLSHSHRASMLVTSSLSFLHLRIS